jgi:DNA polymerase-3 subunit epsilon
MTDTLTLHRFEPIASYEDAGGLEELHGLFVDVETTGLDPKEDSIIELALVPFTFTREGQICDVHRAFVQLEDPPAGVASSIEKLTGITHEMRAGKKIDDAAVERIAKDAALVVAHHAEFDRPFLEERFSVFQSLRWGCSMVDVPWHDEGYTSVKLEWLAFKHQNLFYDAHHADLDCYMGIHLLSTRLPSGRRVMDCVLDAARQHYTRLFACGTDFEARHILKARGYKWNDGSNGRPKAWWIDVRAGDPELAERAWLSDNVFSHLVGFRFDATARFSDRIGKQPDPAGLTTVSSSIGAAQ